MKVATASPFAEVRDKLSLPLFISVSLDKKRRPLPLGEVTLFQIPLLGRSSSQRPLH